MGADRTDPPEWTRRRALVSLVGLGATLGLGCSKSESESDKDAGEAKAADDAGGANGDAPNGDAGTCAPSPEGEVGPYFADDSASGFNRSNLLSNVDGSSTQAGIPLSLTINVVDAEKGCVPYAGAQIDIWHCNASGVYSDISSENTSSDQWLRGYQITDANGQVTFSTIIPGWYSGRTTHIHLRVRSSYGDGSATDDGTNTTQIFFDQTFVDTLATTVSPYDTEGKNPTTNASDRVYSEQESGANVLALRGDNTSGYIAAITIYLPITTTYDGGAAGGGNGGGGPPGDNNEGGPPGLPG